MELESACVVQEGKMIQCLWPSVVVVALTGGSLCLVGCTKAEEHDLIAFVGERIEVVEVPNIPPEGYYALDQKFEASYEVLDILYGRYDEPVIDFIAYDHYGFPPFAEFETALLFVCRHESELIHEKYQLHEVYPTRNGRWAGCGDPYKHEPEVNRGSKKAVPIDFDPEVSFDVTELASEQVDERFQHSYFDRHGTRVVCRAGNYVEDLFAVKRDGVLKARGRF